MGLPMQKITTPRNKWIIFTRNLFQKLDKLDDLRDHSDQSGVKWLNDKKTKMVQKDYGYSRLLDIAKYGNHSNLM